MKQSPSSAHGGTGVAAKVAFSFARPKTARDWRSFGAFSVFLVTLFTEMYGLQIMLDQQQMTVESPTGATSAPKK